MRTKGLPFVCEENGQNPCCKGWVCWVRRPKLHVLVVVVEFPIDALTSEIEGSEVVFAIRVIVWRELTEISNLREDNFLGFLRKSTNAFR